MSLQRGLPHLLAGTDQKKVEPEILETTMAYLLAKPMPSPMTLLRGGVPLSLLMDLVLGPQSEDLLRGERDLAAGRLTEPG